jgi:hypothetical protein
MASGRSQRHLIEVHNRPSNGQGRPVQLTAPTVSPAGPVANGATLTGTNGTFTSTPAATITRFWSRSGVPISGQTAATYVTAAADAGKQVRFGNRGTSIYGSTDTVSVPVSVT